MRPDMAINLFTSALYHNSPITLYGDSNTASDFTYIRDLVCVIKQIIPKLNDRDTLAPIYNIGSQSPISIEKVVCILEQLFGRTSNISRMSLHSGETQITCADTSLLYHHLGMRPSTTIEEGLKNYVEWYLSHSNIRPI